MSLGVKTGGSQNKDHFQSFEVYQIEVCQRQDWQIAGFCFLKGKIE